MNGFIKSRRSAGVYCMKRHINPGQTVSLDELYEQYGVSNDMSPGPEFVKWLRTVKLKRRDIWEIEFDGMSITTGDEPFEVLRKAEEERKAIEAAIEAAKETAKAEKELGPEATDDPKTVEKAEVEENRSGKITLEGDIKVDDSSVMSFSFPSEKKSMVKKEVSERNKQLYGSRIKAPSGVMKSVRSRTLDEDKPKITPADILELKVDELKKIDKVDDLKILKIALKKAEDMRSKSTLCKHLKKRIVKLKPRSRFGSV